MKLEIRQSNDGSSTLYREDIDETYHSFHGAIQESNHVFIESGFNKCIDGKDEIDILEIGFGSGLNALLTILRNEYTEDLKVNYVGCEKHPIPMDVVSQINYGELLGMQEDMSKIHRQPWEGFHAVNERFSLKKMKCDVLELSFENHFDLIYYDAFGPNSQSEMWTIEVFALLFNSLKNGGILVTYCAKGQVRRDLESVGFKMERIPGPPGKREMLRATALK